MSFFNRGLWRQKPQMYGPVSAVQRDIFLNAERCGIDPALFRTLTCFWNGTGTQNTQIGDPLIYSSSSIEWRNKGLYADAFSKHFLLNNNNAMLSMDTFTMF